MVESNNHEPVGFEAVETGSGRGPAAFAGVIDRRRRGVREQADRLIAGAIWLLPSDRALVLAVYRDGVRASDAAAVAGVDARGIRRRLRRLCARVLSDEFWRVVRGRDGWSHERRRIATACVLQGRSKREAARFLQLSLHRVRREMAIVEALIAEGRSAGNERAA